MRRFVLVLVGGIAACRGSGDHRVPAGSGSSVGSGSGSAAVAAGSAPRGATLPGGRDAEMGALVAAGAACPLTDGDIALGCPERKAAEEYAFQHQQSVEVAATCVDMMKSPNVAVRLVAAAALFRMTAVAVTPVFAAALDVVEAEPDAIVRRQLAWGLGAAEAVTAGVTDRVLALVTKLAARPEDEAAAGSLLDTLFPAYLLADAPPPPAPAQAMVLTALARREGDLLVRAFDLVTRVDDKAAACAAVAGAVVVDGPEWWRALAAFVDLTPPCAAQAPAVLGVALAMYGKGEISVPEALARMATRFALTPELRAEAATKLKAARKAAPEWKREDLDKAISAFQQPWAPPPP